MTTRKNNKSLFVEYGKTVRKKRKAQSMTQKDLAHKVGISHEWVCKIEKGKVNVIGWSLIRKINKTLDFDTEITIIDNYF